MIPLRVCLEGFLSYRDRQELRFDGASLYILAGPNGAGKSTIFDAISYALYGEARGTNQERHQVHLINLLSDRMLVEFDFELDGVPYRVRRTQTLRRNRKGRDRDERKASPTVQAYRLRAGPGQNLSEWTEQIIPDTDSTRGLARWLQGAFGIEYEAFTASVMLIQGDSEKLLHAKPSERYEILAELIDLRRFRELHDRVDMRRKELGKERDVLERNLGQMEEVAQEQIARARAEVEASEASCAQAEAQVLELATLKGRAEQWEGLTRQREELAAQARKGAEVLARKEEILAGNERWTQLKEVLGLLQQAVMQQERRRRDEQQIESLSNEIAAGERRLAERARACDECKAKVMAAGAAVATLVQEEGRAQRAFDEQRRLLPWLRELEQRRAALRAALSTRDQVAARRDELMAAEEQLGVEAQEAQEACAQARLQERSLADEKKAAEVRHEQAAARLQRFAGVSQVPVCDHCGQAISGAYAERHRRELVEEVAQAERRRDEARAAHEQAAAERRQREAQEEEAQGKLQRVGQDRVRCEAEHGGLLQKVAALQKDSIAAVAHLGEAHSRLLRPVPDDGEAAALGAARHEAEGKMQRQGKNLQEIEARREERLEEQQRLSHALEEQQAELERERRDQTAMETRRAAARSALQDEEQALASIVAALPARWQGEAARLDEPALLQLQGEEQALRRYREEYAELQRAEQGSLDEQIRSHDRQVAALPAEARRPVKEIENALEECRRMQAERKVELGSQQRRRDDLLRLWDERCRLEAERDRVADDHELHRLVADELGPARLQRHLMQEAERGIVDQANEMLHILSRGNLRLSLNHDEEDGTGSRKALDLLVFNEETSDRPTPISLVSGSQRFRIAISLALAIGRYLAREARPVQSVIIDEGFGCLDDRGRDDMVQVLKALTAHLQRIILVSHQREFIDSFSHGYRVELRDRSSVVLPLEGG